MTVSDGTQTATDTLSWTVSPPANVAPVVDSVTIAPTTPVTTDLLTASVTSHDANGDTLTTSYQWRRAGLDIAGATGATLNLATAGNGDRGDQIDVRVTVNDGTVSSAPVTSAAVTVVKAPAGLQHEPARSGRHRRRHGQPRRGCERRRRRHAHLQRHRPARRRHDRARHGRHQRHPRRHPQATHNVVVTVSDGTLTATDTLTWSVSPPANTPPVVDTVTITPAIADDEPAAHRHGDEPRRRQRPADHELPVDPQRHSTSRARRARRSNLATAGNGDHGDLIRVRVMVNDGFANSAPGDRRAR